MARRKEIKDGLQIGGKVHIVSDKRALPFAVRLLMQGLLAEGMLFCTYAVFIKALPTEAKSDVLLAAVSVCTLLFLLLQQKPKYRPYLYIGTAAAALAALWRFSDAFLAGAQTLAAEWIKSFEEYKEVSLGVRLMRIGTPWDITLILAFLFVLYMLLVTRMLAAGKGKGAALLFMLLLSAQPFLLGKLPAEKELILLVGLVLAAAAMEGAVLFPLREGAAFYVALLYGAALLLSFCFLTKERYHALDVRGKKEAFNEAVENFSSEQAAGRFASYLEEKFAAIKIELPWEGGETGQSGGLDGGRLSFDAEVRFTNETMLQLTLPKDSGVLYLKGYAGAHYTGKEWDGLTVSEEESLAALLEEQNSSKEELQQLPLLLAREKGRAPALYPLQLTYVGANRNYLYAPYGARLDLAEGVRAEQDLFFYPPRKGSGSGKSYVYSVYEGVGNGRNKLPLIFDEKELSYAGEGAEELLYADYAAWAAAVYTKVPEGLARLKALVAKEGPGRAARTEEKVRWVRNYLTQHTSYSLAPGALPEGEEYVEYFLFSSQTGYCAHYATAAVLMLRCLGVPARYAEGYIVLSGDYAKGTANGTVDGREVVTLEIRDTNAHAWVEVFYPECGWTPVEVTASYTAGERPEEIVKQAEEKGEPTPLPLPKQHLDEAKTEPAPTATPVPTLLPTSAPQGGAVKATPAPTGTEPGEQTPDDGTGAADGEEEPARALRPGEIRRLLLAAFALFAAAGLIINRKRLAAAFWDRLYAARRKRLLRRPESEQAVQWYLALQRQLRLYAALPSEELSEKEYGEAAKERYPFLAADKYRELRRLAYAARFGGKPVCEKQAKRAEELYRSLSESLSGQLKGGKKFLFRLKGL